MGNDPQPLSSPRSVVLGTAGHIDHGKTSLVFALTGTDADRLPEEKARGITIDLGFASLTLTDAHGSPIHISLIDVPGHHAFIRNMLAGTGGIDCVMLVIAADEGVKPQTVEHLAICRLLGIRQGILVLTKCDLVGPDRLRQVRSEVQQLVRGTFLADAPILPVSARTGEGIATLKDALAKMAASIPEASRDAVLRLPIDRAFALRGFGTIVTGTLQSGVVTTRDLLEVKPSDRSVRVRGIQTHGRPVEQAHGPTRVALNLTGIEVGELHRGQTLVPADTLSATQTLDVDVEPLPGYVLRHRSQVRVHAFTSETIATVLLYGDPAIHGGSQLVRLKLREPLLLIPGDRLILRRTSPAETVAGGRVLDAAPMPRLRKPAVRAWLQRVRDASLAEQMLARVERRGMQGISAADLVVETGLRYDALQAAARPLIDQHRLIASGSAKGFTHLLWPAAVRTLCERIAAEILRTPGQQVSRAELSSRLELDAWAFDIVWARLAADHRLQANGQHIASRGALTPTAATMGSLARLEQIYRDAGLASPILSEAAAALGMDLKAVWPLTTQLLRAGTLLRMGKDDLLLHADALADLRLKLVRHRGERFDVPRFKAFTGLTRKHVIPLLELLDRSRITRNENGIRTVL